MLDVAAVERRLGYRFRDKTLLETALTHSSFVNEHGGISNERLEFLGDALVNFIAAELLYTAGGDEGHMTERRKRIVSKTPLANAATRLGLDGFLQKGRGERTLSEKTVSDIFEAVAAAIYLDGGLEACRAFVTANLQEADIVDYKSALQQYAQKTYGNGAVRYVNAEQSPFTSVVFLQNKEIGTGKGRNTAEAEQAAAHAAIIKLGITVENN